MRNALLAYPAITHDPGTAFRIDARRFRPCMMSRRGTQV
jgi:hypothetical protein